jgi:hypothetical protein
MAVCDFCGTSYRGGAAPHGKLHFCTHQCRERGRILEVLDQFPPMVVDEEIVKMRSGPCKECGGLAPVDIYKSHQVYSALLWTSWKSIPHFCCQECGRKHQIKGMLYSLFLGWWGVPFGLIITPFQIIRNVIEMTRNSAQPSADFIRIARINLAQRVMASAGARQA